MQTNKNILLSGLNKLDEEIKKNYSMVKIKFIK